MDIIFNKSPKLDLHGYTCDLIIYPIDEFVNDNIKLGNNKIIIIHGVGKGILKKEIKEKYTKDPRIKKLYGDPYNLGITIMELNL